MKTLKLIINLIPQLIAALKIESKSHNVIKLDQETRDEKTAELLKYMR